eukprot:15485476-Alexandrium_andersonii.AAC.1
MPGPGSSGCFSSPERASWKGGPPLQCTGSAPRRACARPFLAQESCTVHVGQLLHAEWNS